MVTIVLLNVDLICAWPCVMFFFSRFLGFLVLGFATCVPLWLLALAPDADGLLRSLAGAGVGVRSLAANREASAVPDTLVRADLDLALDVLGHVPPEVAFHLVVALDPLADPNGLVVGQVPDLAPAVQVEPSDGRQGARGADAVDVAERYVHALVSGKVDAGDSCHAFLLALPLLVARVLGADDGDPAPPGDHLAPVAHLLHRRPNFHIDLHCSHCPGPATDTGRRSCLSSSRRATAPPGRDPREGSGCSSSASSPRCGSRPCARCPTRPGTWRWEAARRRSPRPRSRPSSPSSLGYPSNTPKSPEGVRPGRINTKYRGRARDRLRLGLLSPDP